MRNGDVVDNMVDRFSGDLVKEGLLDAEQLARAAARRTDGGRSLRSILTDLKLLTDKALIAFACRKMNVLPVNLKNYSPDPDTVTLLPETVARRHRVLPLFQVEDTLTVALSNPLDVVAMDEIKAAAGRAVQPVFAAAKDILEAIDWYYGKQSAALKLAASDKDRRDADFRAAEPEPPVVELLDSLLTRAVDVKASDIHIEPGRDKSTVRYRIDGMQRKICSFSMNIHPALISRIKILAELDCAERRKPQDGGFRITMNNRHIDIRVSTFPTLCGENGVLRVLDIAAQPLDMEKLGLSQAMLETYKKLIVRPHGMILVTGPTGSGKTTTLYATLSHIHRPEQTIVTLEDPIEYEIPGIHQSQINPAAGFTFATGLRSLLRQDPDVIMVGEIRDLETANAAVQAATTGHLVFATLHTNDAPGAIVRLLEMGVEPYLIASSVIGVLAQRLIRKLCPSCRIAAKKLEHGAERYLRGKGCKHCWNSGYVGRVGIFELMTVDARITKLIRSKSPVRLDDAMDGGARAASLYQDGLAKVGEGLTTYEELYRITEKDKTLPEAHRGDMGQEILNAAS